MGSILSARALGKPILLMPRRAALGEHRNDHQLDTAAEMAALPHVRVVETAEDLATALDAALLLPEVAPGGDMASADLIGNLRRFIFATPLQETRA